MNEMKDIMEWDRNLLKRLALKIVYWVLALISLIGIGYSAVYNSEHAALLSIALLLFAMFFKSEIL